MHPTWENTPFQVAQDWVKKKYDLNLVRVSSSFAVKGGPAFALLQLRSGLYVVQLSVTTDNNDKNPEHHCVFYNGMEIIDNQGTSKILQIEESDRQSVAAARVVFKANYATDIKVLVSNVYQLV